MKNLIVLNSYDGSPRAINPDHIVKIYKDEDGSCAIDLSDGNTFYTGMDFYDLVDLINKSYE